MSDNICRDDINTALHLLSFCIVYFVCKSLQPSWICHHSQGWVEAVGLCGFMTYMCSERDAGLKVKLQCKAKLLNILLLSAGPDHRV